MHRTAGDQEGGSSLGDPGTWLRLAGSSVRTATLDFSTDLVPPRRVTSSAKRLAVGSGESVGHRGS